MTIIFERRQVNDKVLVVQFQFESHDIKVNGSQVDGFSLDKYLGLDVWAQIYTKLDVAVDKYRNNIEIRLKDETIQMRRAQLELVLSWKNIQPFHREVVRIERKNCDFCHFVMVIKIGMISLQDKYRKQLSQEKSLDKHKDSQKSKSALCESDGSSAIRTSNGSSSNDVEEYVPAARSNVVSNSVNYTPATLTKIIEKATVTEEYTPITQTIEDDKGMVTYTPTKIGDTKSNREPSHRLRSAVKTDVNRNDCNDKKKRNNDAKISELFGDSDSDVDKNVRSNLNLRSKSKDHTDTKRTPKPQKSLDSWVARRQIIKTQNGITDDNPKKRKIDAISPIELVHSVKDDEAKKLKALREEWEQMDEPVTIDSVYNLKDISNANIMDTFAEHESLLRKKFKSNMNVPDCQINPTPNECDYLLILDELVEPEQQAHMYKKLRAKLCKSETEHNITSNHENLLWRLILPEWALQIFMNKFFFTLDEAMDRLRKQDQAKLNSTGFDLDF